jgi:hypothetical protein
MSLRSKAVLVFHPETIKMMQWIDSLLWRLFVSHDPCNTPGIREKGLITPYVYMQAVTFHEYPWAMSIDGGRMWYLTAVQNACQVSQPTNFLFLLGMRDVAFAYTLSICSVADH